MDRRCVAGDLGIVKVVVKRRGHLHRWLATLFRLPVVLADLCERRFRVLPLLALAAAAVAIWLAARQPRYVPASLAGGPCVLNERTGVMVCVSDGKFYRLDMARGLRLW